MIKTAQKQPYTLEIQLESSKPIKNTDHELAHRLAEGVQYCLVGAAPEGYQGFQPIPLGLEDGYVWLMKNAGHAGEWASLEVEFFPSRRNRNRVFRLAASGRAGKAIQSAQPPSPHRKNSISTYLAPGRGVRNAG